jgi:ribonuclease P protein component
MLPRKQRISTQLFKDIIQKGSAFHAPLFSIRIKKTLNNSRFGVSVPKKVAKTAVLRNKIRRRVYSALKVININNQHDVIFIAKIGIEKLKQIELSQEINKIFVKSGLLK